MKVKHETVDVLMHMVCLFWAVGVQCSMWKRDISRAYRSLPVAAEQLQYAGCVFMNELEVWLCTHLALPFGGVGSGYGWHEMGQFIETVVRRLAKAPCGRYVDDYVGAAKHGLQWTAGIMLDVVCALLGTRCDPQKAADHMFTRIVLGAEVFLDFAKRSYACRVARKKARKWAKAMRANLRDGTMEAGEAAKHAGIMSFAVTVAGITKVSEFIGLV